MNTVNKKFKLEPWEVICHRAPFSILLQLIKKIWSYKWLALEIWIYFSQSVFWPYFLPWVYWFKGILGIRRPCLKDGETGSRENLIYRNFQFKKYTDSFCRKWSSYVRKITNFSLKNRSNKKRSSNEGALL